MVTQADSIDFSQLKAFALGIGQVSRELQNVPAETDW